VGFIFKTFELKMSPELKIVTQPVYSSVSQTVIRGGAPGGPQAVLEENALQKLYQTLYE
jgi:hypothetical protein